MFNLLTQCVVSFFTYYMCFSVMNWNRPFLSVCTRTRVDFGSTKLHSLSPCGVGILKWVSLIAGLKTVCLRGRKTATRSHTEKPCWSETSTLQSGQSIVLHLMLNEVSPVEPLPQHYGIVSMMAAQSIPSFPLPFCLLLLLWSASRRHCASAQSTSDGLGSHKQWLKCLQLHKARIAEDKSQTYRG